MKMSLPTKSHTIRFPGELYDKIHLLADNNGRTFNGQVVYLLQIGYTVDRKYFEGLTKQIETTANESNEATS